MIQNENEGRDLISKLAKVEAGVYSDHDKELIKGMYDATIGIQDYLQTPVDMGDRDVKHFCNGIKNLYETAFAWGAYTIDSYKVYMKLKNKETLLREDFRIIYKDLTTLKGKGLENGKVVDEFCSGQDYPLTFIAVLAEEIDKFVQETYAKGQGYYSEIVSTYGGSSYDEVGEWVDSYVRDNILPTVAQASAAE